MKIRKKKSKSVIMARIFQSIRKVGVALLALVCASSIFTVGRTNAGFFDVEESHDNQWVAGSLDGRVTYAERFSVVGMNPNQSPDGRIEFTNEGSLDFRYDVKFRKTGGSDLLCQSLELVAKRNGSSVYTGALADFALLGGQYSLAPFESDTWDMVLNLPQDAGSELEHLTCQWDVDFLAWQTNLPSAADGFSDEESISPNSVVTDEWLTPGDVIINEVMWMGSSVSSADEWIELKNMTGRVINLAGWKIEHAASGGDSTLTIPSGKSIPANGYFLIANYAKTDTNSALNVAPQWVTTTLSLNNSNNGNLVLKPAVGSTVVDTALGATDWPAGTNDTLRQSMERNDIPGDGSLATSWHTCVSGAANSLPYWDMSGVNFGTPLAANLSPIVMNEFVANPIGDDTTDGVDGEWIELYNIVDEDIDVDGWYFTNHAGEVIPIAADRTEGGSTVVPGHGTLVVYLNTNFLGNDSETLALYAPHDLDILTDDVREDVVQYDNANLLPEGKSFARFPDGIGVWIDPETTPGADNALTEDELKQYRLDAYEACFAGEELNDEATDALCSPLFLEFVGLLNEIDDTMIDGSLLLDLLEQVMTKETAALMSLVEEDGVITPDEKVLITLPEILVEEEGVEEEGEDEIEEQTSEEVVQAVTPVSEEEAPVIPQETNIPTDSTVLPEENTSSEVVNPAGSDEGNADSLDVSVPDETVFFDRVSVPIM